MGKQILQDPNPLKKTSAPAGKQSPSKSDSTGKSNTDKSNTDKSNTSNRADAPKSLLDRAQLLSEQTGMSIEESLRILEEEQENKFAGPWNISRSMSMDMMRPSYQYGPAITVSKLKPVKEFDFATKPSPNANYPAKSSSSNNHGKYNPSDHQSFYSADAAKLSNITSFSSDSGVIYNGAEIASFKNVFDLEKKADPNQEIVVVTNPNGVSNIYDYSDYERYSESKRTSSRGPLDPFTRAPLSSKNATRTTLGELNSFLRANQQAYPGMEDALNASERTRVEGQIKALSKRPLVTGFIPTREDKADNDLQSITAFSNNLSEDSQVPSIIDPITMEPIAERKDSKIAIVKSGKAVATVYDFDSYQSLHNSSLSRGVEPVCAISRTPLTPGNITFTTLGDLQASRAWDVITKPASEGNSSSLPENKSDTSAKEPGVLEQMKQKIISHQSDLGLSDEGVKSINKVDNLQDMLKWRQEHWNEGADAALIGVVIDDMESLDHSELASEKGMVLKNMYKFIDEFGEVDPPKPLETPKKEGLSEPSPTPKAQCSLSSWAAAGLEQTSKLNSEKSGQLQPINNDEIVPSRCQM